MRGRSRGVNLEWQPSGGEKGQSCLSLFREERIEKGVITRGIAGTIAASVALNQGKNTADLGRGEKS